GSESHVRRQHPPGRGVGSGPAGGVGIGAVRVHGGAGRPVPVLELHQRQRHGAHQVLLLAARLRGAVPAAVPLQRARWGLVLAGRHDHQQDARARAPQGVQRADPAREQVQRRWHCSWRRHADHARGADTGKLWIQDDPVGVPAGERRLVAPGHGGPGVRARGCCVLRRVGRVV
ncbi:hypothetical protein CFC21_068124, partial [Triticum aestivum]